MFGAPLAYLQEALHKQQSVYWVRVMSVGCYQFHSNPGSNQQTYYVRDIPIVVRAGPPEDKQVVIETCRGY
jgi:hypothetical protein